MNATARELDLGRPEIKNPLGKCKHCGGDLCARWGTIDCLGCGMPDPDNAYLTQLTTEAVEQRSAEEIAWTERQKQARDALARKQEAFVDAKVQQTIETKVAEAIARQLEPVITRLVEERVSLALETRRKK